MLPLPPMQRRRLGRDTTRAAHADPQSSLRANSLANSVVYIEEARVTTGSCQSIQR
jgi:hypothetical protein